jgi:RND family efflux transporter MFP subunit
MKILEKIKKLGIKKILIGSVALIVLFSFLVKNNKTEENFFLAERSDLSQELFETGTIERGENISLSFKEGGRVTEIKVKEGQRVKKNDLILSLDKKEFEIALREAQAGLTSALAGMQRFLAGATPEELGLAGGSVEIAQTNLSSAQKSYQEQEKITDEMLKNAYQAVPVVSGDAFSTSKEVALGVSAISRRYFASVSTSETNSGNRSRDVIIYSSKEIELNKNLAFKENASFSELKTSLEKTQVELRKIIQELDNLINLSESSFFRDKFSEADSALLRDYRQLINLKFNETTSLLGSISSVEAEVNALLTTAQNAVSLAENNLEQAQRESSRVGAQPQVTDVEVRQAAVTQAQARVSLLEQRLQESSLRSPVDGIVSRIMIREGETAVPASPVAIIAPDKDIQISLDIYEGDIPKMSIGNQASVSFVAFPGEFFTGEVVSINPVGQLRDGVVYYRILLILDQYPQEAMIGMTVDVVIKTNERKNVIAIPERVIIQENNQKYVRVLRGKKEDKVEVELGLRGQGRMVEVLSGIEEGDKILID